MAAVTTMGTLGRGPSPFCNLSAISVTIAATAVTYTTATGGLPFDLTAVLQQAAPSGWDAPFGIQAINPADVVGASFLKLSTSGWMPTALVIGTATYTSVPWQSGYNAASPTLPSGNDSATPGYLATCPATIRLYGTGAGNADPFAEIADGSVTDTITFTLFINRNGANN